MQHKKGSPLMAAAFMTAISFQLAGSILIGVFLGKRLDRMLSTEPLFLVIGLLTGLAAGTAAMLRTVRQYFSGD